MCARSEPSRAEIFPAKKLRTLALSTGFHLHFILGPSHLSLSTLGLLLFLLDILSSPQVICFTVSSEHNGREARGTAIAAVNAAVMFIGGIMRPVVGLLLDHCAGDWSSDFALNQFRSAFLILPIAAFRKGNSGAGTRGLAGRLRPFLVPALSVGSIL
ncbi:MAG: hypothetical protein LBB14_01970 [Puniceicoccales bacterium]|jgi:hypothetical protein|nr:hypothetical protein [Puniceicoccales bacterium]